MASCGEMPSRTSDAVTEIAADGELLQHEPAIGADDGDESAFRPEKQCIDGHRKPVPGRLHIKMDFGVFAL
jgi:hypothetical protein